MLLQNTSLYLYQVFINIYWMLKLNLGEESTLWHALSLWDSLSKIRYQISKQMHYILCIIEKKVLIVKKQDLFWACAHTKSHCNKNRIYLHKKRFFQKKKFTFFSKKTKEKKSFSSNRGMKYTYCKNCYHFTKEVCDTRIFIKARNFLWLFKCNSC